MNFSNIRGVLKQDYDLAHLTWFKIGGKARYFFKPKDQDDLRQLLAQNAGKLPVFVLGAGSNVIIRDEGFDGIVIKLARSFNDIEQNSTEYLRVGAGCLNFNLAKYAKENSLAGLEFLIGIPGTIGGGLAMNAGAYGTEYKDIVSSVTAIDMQGNLHEISLKRMGFGYRHNSLSEKMIFVAATVNCSVGEQTEIADKMRQINESRENTQPIREKTGGSTFANPDGYKAWQLIDAAGMRGARVSDAGISEKHCNFMINHGYATAAQMEELGEKARKAVLENSGVELKWEIKRVGR